jgi:hypothetical protein
MQQFHHQAQFSVGEHDTLPLYLIRAPGCWPFIEPYALSPTISSKDTASLTEDASSKELSMSKARKLNIQNLCIRLEASYGSRALCLDTQDTFCSQGCCKLSLDVSIGFEDYSNELHSNSDAKILNDLFKEKSTALKELELNIVPEIPRLNQEHDSQFSKFLWTNGKSLEADTRYDWGFFQTLPKNLCRVSLATVEDVSIPYGWPRFCITALEVAREKFEEVAPTLVATSGTSEKQKVELKSWSCMGGGSPTGWHAMREPETEFSKFPLCKHLWWRWEALSPLSRREQAYEEDIRSIFACMHIIPCIMSQEEIVYKTVSIQGSK